MTSLTQMMINDPNSRLVKQGAEAKVYKAILYPSPTPHTSSSSSSSSAPSTSSAAGPTAVLLKHRFPKQYRHPTLDAQLTRQRLTAEARALVRCRKAGVCVPGLRVVDVKRGVLGIEWIEGWSVRQVLGGGQEDDEVPEGEEEEEEVDDEDDPELVLERVGLSQDALLLSIGAEIAKMHIADLIHGDLTTSNMMLRLTPNSIKPDPTPFELVMIDFGLSSVSFLPEDRAVDLYVLERAFASTHPVPLLAGGAEGVPLFEQVLEGYRRVMEGKGKKGDWGKVEKRLEEVRGRGRKRSMVG